MSKLFRDYSITLAKFKNGKATELETVLALQVDNEFTLKTMQNLDELSAHVSGLPLWQLDKDPLQPTANECLEGEPMVEIIQGETKLEDDETCRVWVIIENSATRGILLNVRSEICNNAGQLGLPGGHKHTNEELEAGALRELDEETGIQLNPGELINQGHIDHKGVRHHFFHKAFHGIEAIRNRGLTTHTDEVVAMKWSTQKGLMDLVRRDARRAEDVDRRCHKSIRRYIDLLSASARG